MNRSTAVRACKSAPVRLILENSGKSDACTDVKLRMSRSLISTLDSS